MKKFLITLLVLGGLGAAFYTSPRLAALLPFHKAPHVQTAKTDEHPTLPPAVSIAKVSAADFIETVMVSGSLVPRDEILVAPEVEGFRVLELKADEGDRVKKGDVLATLVQESLDAQLAQSDASIARADAAISKANSAIVESSAKLAQADADFERAKPLKQSGYLSGSTYDQREAASKTTDAQLVAARDGLKLAQAEKAQVEAQRRELMWRLTNTKVTAPADGLISRRTARIGGMASGIADAMFRIVARGEVELDAEVIETELTKVAIGQKARVSVAGAGEIEGTVRLVSPEVDKTTRLGRVRIFLGDDPRLRIGTFARGSIQTQRSRGLAVPSSAVVFDADGAFVQVVRDGKVKSSNVKIGLISGGLVEVREGLSEGDVVVARAGTFLRDGDTVRPVQPELKDQRGKIIMRLNISAWSIRRPVPAIVLFCVLTLLGVIAFMTLPVTRFPNIDVPLVSITVVQSGAAPAELESQVTKEVEDAVANIPGVKHIMSTVTDGQSQTVMEFRLEVNQDRALNDVKDAIDKIRLELPRDINEPIVQRIDVEGQSILTYAASSPGMTLEQLSWHVDDVIKRQLQALKGVGRVERYGGVDREIRVLLDPDRLLAFGITAADVNTQVRATNVDLGGGRGEVGGQEQAIRTLAGARKVEDLADTKIVLPGKRYVRLADLGRVVDDASEQRSFARLNGEPVVTFSVFRSKGSSELSVADVVAKRLDELSKRYPEVHLTKVDDAVAYTRGNYTSAMETLLEGAALAVLVVLLFLRNLRATIIAAIALPLSAIPTFWAMQLMGFSLNLVSLLGITLVTGILVDDAIVEIENIVRHMRTGKSPYRAAIEAADEIGLAVIAISLTIVAIFSPVSFMGGIAGQYFRQFGLTVAVAVLFSLLIARLLTPVMAAYFLRPVPEEHEGGGIIMRGYLGFLRGTLKVRYLTLVVGLGLFAGSIYATTLLPTGFMPDEDNSRIVVSVELPPGATLEDTRATTDHMVTVLDTIPEVKSVFVLGGSTPTGGLEVRKSSLFIHLVPKTERALPQKAIKIIVSDKLATVADTRSWFVNERGERELSFSMLSQNGEDLNTAVRKLEGALRLVPGFKNVAADAAIDRPELRVVPKFDEAAKLGVAPSKIAETIRVATIGDIDANLAKFNAGDRLVPIRVQIAEDARTEMQRLANLRVTNSNNDAIPLSAVADVNFGRGPSSVSRYDRERRAVIGVDLKSRYALSGAREKFLAVVDEQKLPPSVRLQPSGDAEIQDEVATGFITAMGTGLMIVFGVLVLLFGSVAQPVTILLSLPLSFGGVVLALLATGNSVSMPVYIGLLMLMGIVCKNAIMLVDFAVEQVAKGVPRFEAVIDAGRKRARPIVMTTLAMVAGMVPSAMAIGDGGEFRAPMAIAVIGGLLVSTVLSLVFVPSFFTVMDDIGRLVWWIFGRFVGPVDEAPDLPAHAPHQLPAPVAHRAIAAE